MSERPYYVVETSGYRILPHGERAHDHGTEHELAVVGPNGVHAWHRVVERGRWFHDYDGRYRPFSGTPYRPYRQRLAHWRAAAASVCAILNAEARG